MIRHHHHIVTMWRRIVFSHLKTLAADVIGASPRRSTALCGELASEIEIQALFSRIRTVSGVSHLNLKLFVGFGRFQAIKKGIDSIESEEHAPCPQILDFFISLGNVKGKIRSSSSIMWPSSSIGCW
ncbi:unnamed protein product [Arabidopsis halleri]